MSEHNRYLLVAVALHVRIDVEGIDVLRAQAEFREVDRHAAEVEGRAHVAS